MGPQGTQTSRHRLWYADHSRDNKYTGWPITYWRKMTAYATSYDETCLGCNDYTSSGHYLDKGVIAVTLDWYRYMQGMRVYIPGYGFATIEDVGQGVPWSTNWVDLGYRHKDLCDLE